MDINKINILQLILIAFQNYQYFKRYFFFFLQAINKKTESKNNEPLAIGAKSQNPHFKCLIAIIFFSNLCHCFEKLNYNHKINDFKQHFLQTI